MKKPREVNINVELGGWEAYLIDELMEYPLTFGRNRVNTVEMVVCSELDRIYRQGKGVLTHQQMRDKKKFGGVSKILEEARKQGYIPGRVEEDREIVPEEVEKLILKSFTLDVNFRGIPAYMINTLLSRGRFQKRGDVLVRSLISEYHEEHADLMARIGDITRENAAAAGYLRRVS